MPKTRVTKKALLAQKYLDGLDLAPLTREAYRQDLADWAAYP
jgi:hypothetical protein